MDQTLINRYQPGGDIYATLVSRYGTAGADTIAAAAATGDNTQLNYALANAQTGMTGGALNDSTASILAGQLATDPLAAPLGGLNNALNNSILSFLKNPTVLLALAVVLFFAFGGATWIRNRMAK
jgi:hypothetical protein